MKQPIVILHTLKEIYPLPLLLLVFVPLLLGLCIDSELINGRDILIHLIWIPLFTIPYLLLRKKIIYQTTVILYFIAGTIEIVHWILLKGPLTLTSLLVLSNTNYQEAQEFFDLKASFALLIIIPYTALVALALRSKLTYALSKTKYIVMGIIALICISFIGDNVIHQRLIRKGIPAIAKVGASFIDQHNLYKEAMQEIAPKNVTAKCTFNESRQTVVLILGESCNRNHMSLYTAKRNTNPKLKKRNDLVCFTNVVSPYSNTLNSVLTILSNSNLERPIDFGKAIDVLDIFHSAGFKTYWISNQSPIGVWDNMVTVLAKKSDTFKFVNTTSNSSFEAIQTASFDSKLFKPLATALNEQVNKKFIIVHLMGSHATYKKRYPSNFNVFKGTDAKSEQIAEYDNSVLYSDFIVDSLLNLLANNSIANNSIASAIYLSDHGENVYDELDKIGHDYTKQLPKSNVEIPFFIWLSPKFLVHQQAKFSALKLNSSKPFVSDDLFHSIMDVNGIESPFLEEKRSIFNTKFNSARKRILEDGLDYDAH